MMKLIKQYFSDDSIKLVNYKNVFDSKYRLCYVDKIPVNFEDISPATEVMYKSKEYLEYKKQWLEHTNKLLKEKGSYSSRDLETWERENGFRGKFVAEYCTYMTEEFFKGFTHYFFFTDNFEQQWGDDWNDVPYEHNAEWPYSGRDSNVICLPLGITYELIMQQVEHNIITTEEYNEMTDENFNSCDIKYPCDYGINSPFSVDMINHGAVPWIWFYKAPGRVIDAGIAINGGDTVMEVIHKVTEMNKLVR